MDSRCVLFDLPFALLLPDSLAEGCDGDGLGLAPEIFVNAPAPGAVRTGLRFRTAAGVTAGGVLKGGDPYGRVSFTRVLVRFHPAATPETSSWSDDELIWNAVDLANRVVSEYRAITGQSLFRPVSPRDLVHFQINDGGSDSLPVWRSVLKGRGPLEVGLGPEQLEVDKKLRDRVQSADGVPFLRDIELNPYSDLAMRDFRMAVVQAETFFEAWIRRLLSERFRQLGLSDDEIAQKFCPGGSFRSIKGIVKHLIKEVWDEDFLDSEEGKHWDTACRKLRNEIVHGEREAVSEAEANDAIRAVQKSCRLISGYDDEMDET